ncbi:MAG: flagellar FlbD family protein [Labilithrix sp.]
MLKLTRLDHRTVAINPDHIAWVESNPDTTLCLIGDRKIIVRESMDEVIERFTVARQRIGNAGPISLPSMPPPSSNGRRSGRPSGGYSRPSLGPVGMPAIIVGDDREES